MYHFKFGAEKIRYFVRRVVPGFKFRTSQAKELLKNKRVNKRMLLGPYYYFKQLNLKKKLQAIEPDASSLF